MKATAQHFSSLIIFLGLWIGLSTARKGNARCSRVEIVPKIAHGDEAPEGRFPYMCSIHTSTGAVFACGGFLIHPQWVMTAAHCVDPKDGSAAYNGIVSCGVYDRSKFDADNTFLPIRTHIHPKYKSGNVSEGYDIALLEFREGFDLPMPKLDLGRFCEFRPGQQFTALGWGAEFNKGPNSNKLQQATTLEIFPSGKCALPGSRLKEHQLCAISTQDTCTGDSGGPLLETDRRRGRVEDGKPEKDIIVGVISFGGRDCGENQPGIYTKISDFSSWIVKTTKKRVKKIAGKCEKQTPTEDRRSALTEEHEDEPPDVRVESISAAIKVDDADLAAVLLGLGVDPNSDDDGVHLLHLAAIHDAAATAKVLIAGDADINIQDSKGMTPLMIASRRGHLAVLRVLLRNHAQKNVQDDRGYTAVHHAAILGRVSIIKELILSRAILDVGDTKGWTPLHHAARKGHVKIVKLLVESCADTLRKSDDGRTPEDVICHPLECTALERKHIMEYLS